MNNGPYLHSSNNTRKIILYYILAMMPLIIYGFYKNGILVFLAKKTNIVGLFKPLLFPIFGYLIGVLCEALYLKFSKKNQNWKEDIFYSFLPLNAMIVGMLVPTGINLLVFLFLLFLTFLTIKCVPFFQKVNQTAFSLILIFVILLLTGKLQFLNPLEESKEYAFQLIDLLFGRNIGGVCATNIVFMIIGYFFLSILGFYKKDIPIYIIASYFILSLIFGLSSHHFLSSMTNFLSYSIIFVSVFCATDSMSAPYTKRGKLIYGVLIGIIGYFLGMVMNPTLGILLSVFVVSIFSSYFDDFVLRLSK